MPTPTPTNFTPRCRELPLTGQSIDSVTCDALRGLNLNVRECDESLLFFFLLFFHFSQTRLALAFPPCLVVFDPPAGRISGMP